MTDVGSTWSRQRTRPWHVADRDWTVLDDLSGTSPGAHDEAFPPQDAERILRRLAVHHTPKHASWLVMVETGVLHTRRIDRRIPDRAPLEGDIAPSKRQRDRRGGEVHRMSITQQARAKLARSKAETVETSSCPCSDTRASQPVGEAEPQPKRPTGLTCRSRPVSATA